MSLLTKLKANAVGIFSPAIVLVVYVVIASTRGEALDAETAFTTMAILSMVTHPANMVMTIVPRLIAALAGFERIQDYLLRPSLEDKRELLPTATVPNLLTGSAEAGNGDRESASVHTALSIRNLSLGEQQSPILEGINIEAPAGSLVIISGPVGCGKSTLLRAIIGEMAPIQGSIDLSTKKVAYCAQRPWLASGSIEEAILGGTTELEHNTKDAMWYRQVVGACCLRYDFETLPAGDQTQIGSGGINLSGGQKQRVVCGFILFEACDVR